MCQVENASTVAHKLTSCWRFGNQCSVSFQPIIPRREYPFDDPAWGFELKLDGLRCIADTIELRLISKQRNRMKRFERLLDALPRGYVFDGEIACLDETGRPTYTKVRPKTGALTRNENFHAGRTVCAAEKNGEGAHSPASASPECAARCCAVKCEAAAQDHDILTKRLRPGHYSGLWIARMPPRAPHPPLLRLDFFGLTSSA